MLLRECMPLQPDDVIAFAKDLEANMESFTDPELFMATVEHSLSLLNTSVSAISVAGTKNLIVHADRGFTLDTDAVDFDQLEMDLGQVEDVYCRGKLFDMVWLGSLSVSGFAARFFDVHMYEEGARRPRPLHHRLVLPVQDIRGYVAAE